MHRSEIISALHSYHAEGKKLFITSSFQTHSIPLLHLVANSGVPVDVLFIQTGFHFPETLEFRDRIAQLLDIDVINVTSQVPKSQQRDASGQFFFVSDPDRCCYLNKIQPLEPYLMQYDIWINGVRADQSETRKAMQVEQDAPFNTKRFHPILDWSSSDIYKYRMEFDLPEHPLDTQGYSSIGCAPCTQKLLDMDERAARWFGLNKTECGLHTDLIK
jgi:phosphoadenosine phosphosulfate reductase